MAILCKIAVPIFFMISGALLLGKEEPIIDMYKKRILRIIVTILLFSFIQYIYLIKDDILSFSIIRFLKDIYQNPIIVPYWYLYSYLSFLLILPFLRKMVKNMEKSEYIYMFILWITFSFIMPIMQEFLHIPRNNNLMCLLLETSIFYPLVGYFCENYFEVLNKKKIMIGIFLFSILCILLGVK